MRNVRTLDSQVTKSLTARRLTLSVTWLFAALAVGLAAVGVYAVLAYSVSRRTREMGIRLALGATKSAVLGLVFREGMSLVFVGTLIGVMISLGLSRLLSNQLFGVGPMDPVTFSVVPVLLIAIAAAACWHPARRATKVSPIEALRYE